MDTKKYSLILSIPTESPYGEFLEHVCSKITLPSGKYLLHFYCSEIISTHPVYLEFVACATPTTVEGLRYRIPHSLIFLIGDPPLDENQIGFQT